MIYISNTIYPARRRFTAQGAELVVLPEGLNWYKGDGPGNPNALTCQEAALDDWENQTAILRETAVKCKVALTIPVLTREGNDLTNSFFLISKTGQTLGRYQKMRPTPGELREGVRPGKPSLIEWEGLKVGGAICFDSCFSEVFEQQVEAGAQLFLMPSLWPGGVQLNHWALQHSTPIAVAYPAWSRSKRVAAHLYVPRRVTAERAVRGLAAVLSELNRSGPAGAPRLL